MKLKNYLKKNAQTQIEFAKKLGITKATLNTYIKKRAKIPKATVIAIDYLSKGEVKAEDWENVAT
jgi:DNA-binding transcriptional regulator YdaS (Cro superfamily)